MTLTKKLKRALSIYACQQSRLDFLAWFFLHAEKLERFKDIHKGQSCFIIGNGPSLNKMDLSLLKGCNIFGLNKIYLLFDKVDLRLTYHVAVNPFVIKQSKEIFESLDCPTFLSYKAAKDVIDVKPNIHFLATGGGVKFSEDIINVISEGWTVTYVALQLAYYMGFKNVFLIGVDHNFKAQGNPNETQILHTDDPNHFDPNYFKNQPWQLPDLEGSEISYRLAKFFYERNDRNIHDATLNGKLTIFNKISFEQALELCQ